MKRLITFKTAFFALALVVATATAVLSNYLDSGKVITCFEETDTPWNGERVVVHICKAPKNTLVWSNFQGQWVWLIPPSRR